MLGHITLRGDYGERYYSYGFSKEKNTLLYCTLRDTLPHIFNCAAFKKHHGFILDENQKKVSFSKLILYLHSTLDRKEKFLQWKDHVHLNLIDVSYKELKLLNDGNEMNLALLDNKTLRKRCYSCLLQNDEKNLIRNSDAYFSKGGKTNPDHDFQWIDDSYKQGQQKFQLSY